MVAAPGRLRDMRRFTREFRLQADSVVEITEGYEKSVAGLSRSVKYNSRKLRPGPLLNALALWFAELDDAERISVARAAVKRLERLMGSDEGEAENCQGVAPAPLDADIQAKTEGTVPRSDGTPPATVPLPARDAPRPVGIREPLDPATGKPLRDRAGRKGGAG